MPIEKEDLDYYDVGITAGVFDLLHTGHLKMLEEMNKRCHSVVVAVQVDPSKYRKGKSQPVESIFERTERLKACAYVSEVIPYETESDLETILTLYDYDIRFIGADHKGKPFTGDHIKPETHYFNSREHTLSSSSLKERVFFSVIKDKAKAKVVKETTKVDGVGEVTQVSSSIGDDTVKNTRTFVTREDFYDEVEKIQNKEQKEDLNFIPAQ